ncbi:MAG: heavy-metal-associated domain-containing protein [Firmicutes bacterium]|nr:heavy-metal-associated domain-containing protein [Bacillota bacterium]
MPEAGSKRVTFHVPGMSCSHCRTAISKVLGESRGVIKADVDLPAKTVIVDYDPERASLDDLKRVLTQAGYTPQGGSQG